MSAAAAEEEESSFSGREMLRRFSSSSSSSVAIAGNRRRSCRLPSSCPTTTAQRWFRFAFLTVLCFVIYVLTSDDGLDLGFVTTTGTAGTATAGGSDRGGSDRDAKNWFVGTFFRGGFAGGGRRRRQCSCVDPGATRRCCRRELLVEHKMGTFLISSVFHPTDLGTGGGDLLRLVARIDKNSVPRAPEDDGNDDAESDEPPTPDYRHVVTTRNWYEAIVSGYLYHRSGRECWLTTTGAPAKRGEWRQTSMNWDDPMRLWSGQKKNASTGSSSVQQANLLPHLQRPPAGNRSICRYLADESEEAGMLAYMDWSLRRYYGYLVEYRANATTMKQRRRQQQQKSLFLCYEDWMSSASRREEMYEASLAFLFPGGGSDRVRWRRHHEPFGMYLVVGGSGGNSSSGGGDSNRTKGNGNNGTLLSATAYGGGHATSHDPELRSRLRALVEKLDMLHFDGTVRASDAVFGCGQSPRGGG